MTSVLVTLPVYNEAPRLERSIEKIEAALREAGISYRIAIAEDGSTDGTKESLRRLAESRPDLIIRTGDRRMGRGRAIRDLWSSVQAEVYAFTDVDLAAGPEYLVQAIRRVQDGEEIVVGSRYLPDAEVERPWARWMVSRAYNWAVRTIFRDGIRDHQCGLKVFRASAILRLLPLTREDSWFWDTEILVVAHSDGYPVTEIPVHWREAKAARTRWRRLASDVFLHGAGLVRLQGSVRTPANPRSLGLGPAAASVLPGSGGASLDDA